LTLACASGSAELVELLYKANAKEAPFESGHASEFDFELTLCKGDRVPLQVAVRSENPEVVRVVLKHSKRIDMNARVSPVTFQASFCVLLC
jgi:hypothetical protein